MELTKEQRVMQQVISKAWNDDNFKKALISDPINAIEKLTGEKIALPKGKRLEAFDQSNADVIYLNIPPAPNLDDVELSDKDLELVAGGVYPIGIIDGCIPTFPPSIPIDDPLKPITTRW
jgi:hypothetical protein